MYKLKNIFTYKIFINRKPLKMVRPICKAISKILTLRLTTRLMSDTHTDRKHQFIVQNCFAI